MGVPLNPQGTQHQPSFDKEGSGLCLSWVVRAAAMGCFSVASPRKPSWP